jgi:hypothetical protein
MKSRFFLPSGLDDSNMTTRVKTHSSIDKSLLIGTLRFSHPDPLPPNEPTDIVVKRACLTEFWTDFGPFLFAIERGLVSIFLFERLDTVDAVRFARDSPEWKS